MIWFDIADDLLPPVYQAIKDMYAYARTLDTTLRDVLSDMNEIKDNFFIQTCDEDTLEYWENLLQIEPIPGDTDEKRRQDILMYLNNQNPYTEKFLRSNLDRYLGEGNYLLDVYPEEYRMTLFFTSLNPLVQKQMINLVTRIKPAHIALEAGITLTAESDNTIVGYTSAHNGATSSASMSTGNGYLYLGDVQYPFTWIQI